MRDQFGLGVQRQSLEQWAIVLRIFLQEGEHGLAGLVAAADILQAGVLGGEGQSQLLGLLEIVVPGGAMESLLGKHLRAVCADLLEQGVPARQVGPVGGEEGIHGGTVDQVVDATLAKLGAMQRVIDLFAVALLQADQGVQVAFDEGRIGNRHFPLGEVSLHRSVQRLRHGGVHRLRQRLAVEVVQQGLARSLPLGRWQPVEIVEQRLGTLVGQLGQFRGADLGQRLDVAGDHVVALVGPGLGAALQPFLEPADHFVLVGG